MKTKHVVFAILIAVIACFATLPVNAASTGHFERTLQVFGATTVEIYSGSGNITVRTGSGNTVQINARIHSGNGSWLFGEGNIEEKIKRIEQNPPVAQLGNTVRIGRFEDHEIIRNISIDYDVTVPAQSSVTSHTGSGDQSVNGVQAPVTAKTGSGNITLDNIGGAVRAESGSGDIKINGVKGTLDAHTGSGNIHAYGVGGAIVAHTGSGRIEMEQTAPGDVRAETGSGSINLRGIKGGLRADTGSGSIHAEGEPSHDWRMGTGSGNITLKIPSQASFSLDARTSSGSLRIGHTISVEEQSRKHLRAKAGNGGPVLDIHTGSGDIELD